MQTRLLSISLIIAFCFSATAQNTNTEITSESKYFEGTFQASKVSEVAGIGSIILYAASFAYSLCGCGSPDGSDSKASAGLGLLAWLVHFGSSSATAIEGRLLIDSADATNENEGINCAETGWWLNIAGKIGIPIIAASIIKGSLRYDPEINKKDLYLSTILWTTFITAIPTTIGDGIINHSLSEIEGE